MEPIIAALISATASIVVALIGRHQQSINSDEKTSAHRGLYKPTLTWLFLLVPLALWVVLSPNLISYQLIDINLFVIPIVTLLAAAIWPIRPFLASAFVLLVYATYYATVPISWDIPTEISSQARPISEPLHFMHVAAMSLLDWSLRIALTITTSVLAGFMCLWRVSKQTPTTPLLGSSPKGMPASDAVTGELERLVHLYGRGLLTDDEFVALKRRLLLGPPQKG